MTGASQARPTGTDPLRSRARSDIVSCISAIPVSSYAIPFKVPGSQSDRLVLHYYCTRAASELSGYLPSDFWTRSLLQSSHQEPAVRHALIALGTLKLSFETSSSPVSSMQTMVNPAVQAQYNKALGHLRKYMRINSEPSVVVVLKCCVLFHAFESLRQEYKSALQHLENGLTIHSNATRTFSGGSELDAESPLQREMTDLGGVLSRMDIQATMFDDTRVPLLQQSQIIISESGFSATPDAQSCLDNLINDLFNMLTRNLHDIRSPIESLPLALVEKKASLLRRFDEWERANEKLSQRRSTKNEEGACAELYLAIIHQTGRLLLQSRFPNNFDVFTAIPNPSIARILNMAEELVSTQEGQAEPLHQQRRVYSAETGIIAPLFLIAIKCGDPTLSSQAARLFSRVNRREGFHDSQMLMGIVHKLQGLRAVARNDGFDDQDTSSIPTASSSEDGAGLTFPSLEFVKPEVFDMPGGWEAVSQRLGD